MKRRNFLAIATSAVGALLAPAPARAEEILARGKWTKVSYAIRGEWEIVAREDGARLIRFDADFKTRRGPDLKVFLSPDPLAEVEEGSAAARSFEIGALAAHRGAQQYEIPARLNLADYRALLIHCKSYAHLWGGADLAR